METRFKFTKTALEAIICPSDKSKIRVTDTVVPGLTLLLTAGGARTFYHYCKFQGKPSEYKIGTMEAVTLDQARKVAAWVNNEHAADRDPRLAKQEARNATTLQDLWETYRKAVVKRPRTMIEDEGIWRRYLEPWGSRRLSDLTDDTVQSLHNRIAAGKLARTVKDSKGHVRKIKGGATAARLTVALLSGMFTECAKKLPNPARGIRREAPTAKERYLAEEELPAFWAALTGQSATMRDLFKMALFTAQRRTTLLEMRWDEINLNFGTWTIPAEKMKGGKAHVVPLVKQAAAILTERAKAAKEGEEWVFPGDGDTGHVQEVKKAIAALVKASGLADFTLHDLRRTAATWLNSTGASLSTIQAILAQRPQTVAGIHYVKATADAARQALQTAVDAMETAATIAPSQPVAAAG
jgi:integrase